MGTNGTQYVHPLGTGRGSSTEKLSKLRKEQQLKQTQPAQCTLCTVSLCPCTQAHQSHVAYCVCSTIWFHDNFLKELTLFQMKMYNNNNKFEYIQEWVWNQVRPLSLLTPLWLPTILKANTMETLPDGKDGLTKLRQSLQNMMIKKPEKHSRRTALSLLLLIYLQLGPTNMIRAHFVTFWN